MLQIANDRSPNATRRSRSPLRHATRDKLTASHVMGRTAGGRPSPVAGMLQIANDRSPNATRRSRTTALPDHGLAPREGDHSWSPKYHASLPTFAIRNRLARRNARPPDHGLARREGDHSWSPRYNWVQNLPTPRSKSDTPCSHGSSYRAAS